jgi:hypothetical protein
MPSSDMIIYAAVSGLIAILLIIIGYLLMLGFQGIKEEIKGLRADIKEFDAEKVFLRSEIAAIKANCKAQASNGAHFHKRTEDE